jgi:hypothetical protein
MHQYRTCLVLGTRAVRRPAAAGDDAKESAVASESLLAGLYPPAELDAYLTRQRRDPQPGMRRVDPVPEGFACWHYEDHRWARRAVLRDRCDALSWWLADPWLPTEPFGPNAHADTAVFAAETAADLVAPPDHESDAEPGPELTPEPGPGPGPPDGTPEASPWSETPWSETPGPGTPASGTPWPEARWQEAALALSFHVVMETGARPHDVGPESTETGALVYRRLCDRRAAAQIYWYEGRSSWDDMRASCPLRTDISSVLRCAVLAEAAVLLDRRPHQDAYIGIDSAPAGVAPEAARILGRFGIPSEAYRLLLR